MKKLNRDEPMDLRKGNCPVCGNDMIGYIIVYDEKGNRSIHIPKYCDTCGDRVNYNPEVEFHDKAEN